MADDELAQILDRINSRKLPPVEQWNPELTGEIDMRITADGSWYYRGSSIQRQRMIKLFSSILRVEHGTYYLVTPVEKYRIEVEDAPFVAVEVDRINSQPQALLFRTSLDEEVIADSTHKLFVNESTKNATPRPYVHIRNGLNALIHRNVFYQLVDWARPEKVNGMDHMVIDSQNQIFSLGAL